jgi:transposase
LTTKIHALVDALGNPVEVMLSPGQDHDLTCAEALIEAADPGVSIADKAFDADVFIAALDDRAIVPVIPSMRRIDELFAIEREIKGKPPEVRRAGRQERSKPLVAALETYMREQFERLSPKNDLAKAIHYMLVRWPSFTRFRDDGRICLSNNASERALRCVAVGRRNWTFAGSDAGGRRAAAIYSLITTCKLNDVDPRAWLADVLARLPDHPAHRVGELMPWAWKTRQEAAAIAATAAAA